MLFVDVVRPLRFPESAINAAIVKAIGCSPFILDAKRRHDEWERALRGAEGGARPKGLIA